MGIPAAAKITPRAQAAGRSLRRGWQGPCPEAGTFYLLGARSWEEIVLQTIFYLGRDQVSVVETVSSAESPATASAKRLYKRAIPVDQDREADQDAIKFDAFVGICSEPVP